MLRTMEGSLRPEHSKHEQSIAEHSAEVGHPAIERKIERLMQPPTIWEWIYVYAPLAVALLVACVRELKTVRIPNWLSFLTLIYLLGARAVHQPQDLKLFLLSFVISLLVMIGVGWMSLGTIGGGSAKLAVAVCTGLHPALAACISILMVTISRLAGPLARKCGVETLPGSVVLTTIVVGAVGSLRLFGHQ